MTVIASLAALVLIQTPAQTPAQTPPPAPGSSVTRDLNSGPPAPATYLAPAPAPAAAAPVTTTPAPAEARPAAGTPAPASTTPRPAPAVAPAPARTTPPVATPTPTPARTTPAPVVAAPVTPTAAAPAPAAATPATEAAPAPPPPPSYTVLDGPARAALPFRIDLPAGFMIDAERSGPDFKMYAVRRNGTPFVMIYAGPSSQFPIYGGEQMEAAGRTSVVTTEDGQRHAMEHLFQRATAPREVHIWVASLDGADRTLAEAIAQSVNVP